MNKLKHLAKAWILMNGVFFLLMTVTNSAWASDSIDLNSLISNLPEGWIGSVTGIFIVLYAVAQLRAVLPPSVTRKIPRVVMLVLDFVAANYKHARNAEIAPALKNEKASGKADVDYRIAVETAKNQGELRGSRIESAGTSSGNNNPDGKATK